MKEKKPPKKTNKYEEKIKIDGDFNTIMNALVTGGKKKKKVDDKSNPANKKNK